VGAGVARAERLLGARDHVGLLAQDLVGDDHRPLDAQPLGLERQLADCSVAEHDAGRLEAVEAQIGRVIAHFSSRNCVGTLVAHSTSSLDALTYFTMMVIWPLSSSFFCIIALIGSSS